MIEAGRRLWLVTRVYAPEEGGVQTYAREVARAYVALGWEVTLFAKSSAGPRRATEAGLELVDVGPGSAPRVLGKLLGAMLRARLGGQRPQAIHACTWRAAIPALPFRRPLIVAVHGREVGRPRGIAGRLMRSVLRRADRIVAVSDATRALLLERMPDVGDRCIVAWNGAAIVAPPVPTAFQRGAGEPELLTVCRLVPRKNVRVAVAAAALCHHRGRRFRYRIVGRGPESAGIGGAIAAGDVDGRIEQLGYVEQDAVEVLQARADIFLHPQLALEGGDEVEGFGISVADAMAHGLACIVGAEGGPAELVRDGVTGLVVDGRSTEAVAGALDRLLRDPELRTRMGAQAGRWAAENLSWRQHCLRSVEGLRGVPAERTADPA